VEVFTDDCAHLNEMMDTILSMPRLLNRKITAFYSNHNSLFPEQCIYVLPCMGFVVCNSVYYVVNNPCGDEYSLEYTIIGQIKASVQTMIQERSNIDSFCMVSFHIQLGIKWNEGTFNGFNFSVLHFPETHVWAKFMLLHGHVEIEKDVIRIQRKVRRGRIIRILKRGEWSRRVRHLTLLRATLSIFPNEIVSVILEDVMTTSSPASIHCNCSCPIDRIQIEDLQELRSSQM
jgi:hypothetical protein